MSRATWHADPVVTPPVLFGAKVDGRSAWPDGPANVRHAFRAENVTPKAAFAGRARR